MFFGIDSILNQTSFVVPSCLLTPILLVRHGRRDTGSLSCIPNKYLETHSITATPARGIECAGGLIITEMESCGTLNRKRDIEKTGWPHSSRTEDRWKAVIVWRSLLSSMCALRQDVGYTHGINWRFFKDWRNHLLKGVRKPAGCWLQRWRHRCQHRLLSRDNILGPQKHKLSLISLSFFLCTDYTG